MMVHLTIGGTTDTVVHTFHEALWSYTSCDVVLVAHIYLPDTSHVHHMREQYDVLLSLVTSWMHYT